MQRDLYSARIGESICIASEVPYEALVKRIMEFTVRAAVARSTDDSDWEQDQLRRGGLATIQLFRNGKAVWSHEHDFEIELAEARRQGIAAKFLKANQIDPVIYERLERDLRIEWSRVGYHAASLANDMKKLFAELERDLADRAAEAKERLLAEVVGLDAPPRPS
ncbi:MAG: hypothetical protein JO078_11095 [Candidatus Eremiobacteraeota bacterium]|nr:hypothetical protein [Candidatus Eremiobacteraeota bacterium]